MRHDDRSVLSVHTHLALGRTEKVQAAQEVVHKGSPPLSCVGLERNPTRAVASSVKAVIDRLPLHDSARQHEGALALPASTSVTTGPLKRADLAAWGATVASIVVGREEQGR
jgi:hypothetical protein